MIKLSVLRDSRTGKPIEVEKSIIESIPFMDLVEAKKEGRRMRELFDENEVREVLPTASQALAECRKGIALSCMRKDSLKGTENYFNERFKLFVK